MRRAPRTTAALRSRLSPGHPALRRIRLTARFVRAALVRVPLYGFGGAAALLAVALLYSRSTDGQGILTTIGDSSIVVIYPVLGFIGGSLLGGAAAVRDPLDFFERQLPPWLDEVAGSLGRDPFPSMPLAELVLRVFERHPLGSQSFVPLGGRPYLVAVAPPVTGLFVNY